MVNRILVLLFFARALGAAEPYYRVVEIAGSDTKLHSRDPNWKPGKGLALEVGGLAVLDNDKLAVATRKGDIWILSNVYSEEPGRIRHTRFASGLDEPLGLLRFKDESGIPSEEHDLLTVQRTEVTRIRDVTGDEIADEYLTVAKGWSVTGAYHAYAYGPVRDGDGNLWVTLNLDMGDHTDNTRPWRGWAMRIDPEGKMEAVAAGMRSPCGLGTNQQGDVFTTDQQGNWIPTNSLLHLRDGAYFGNPDGMTPASLPESLVRPLPAVNVNGKPFPEALKLLPQLRAPAVWFPYNKMGQSRTDILLDSTAGKFGPFTGQLFVGEFTQSKIGRVYLEKIEGEYQGACFPFLEGFPAAVMRLEFGTDGSLFAGMTNRGWSSVGGGSYGLHRVIWSGKTPFEIKEMRAMPYGFQLVFTRSVDPVTASDPNSYAMSSYTYPLHRTYGGNEIQTEQLVIERAEVWGRNIGVNLHLKGLRPYFVHELHYDGVRSANGEKPWHNRAYYTLNRIPKR